MAVSATRDFYGVWTVTDGQTTIQLRRTKADAMQLFRQKRELAKRGVICPRTGELVMPENYKDSIR